MKIEIVYALKNKQFFYTENIDDGTNVGQALARSKLLKDFPNLDISKVGIFSRPVNENYILQENDRIEIYRPLIIDPKEQRKQRANKNK